MPGYVPKPSPTVPPHPQAKSCPHPNNPAQKLPLLRLNLAMRSPEASAEENRPPRAERLRDWAWADLMRRVFDLDVLLCPRCGGRMSMIATIEADDVLRKILGHLGLPTDPPAALPPRPPPPLPDLFPDTRA